MGGLTGESRDRVRAMSLWLVTGIVLAGVAVGLYALVVGFDSARPAPVSRVAEIGQHDLLVQYVGGSPGCGDPLQVKVDETEDEVLIAASVVVRRGTRLGASCDGENVTMLQTVRLAAPLGDRAVRDASRPELTVPVADEAADLVG
ncbi:hypothetical protein [Georgenia sp. SUBG003]|uniref:hypothetical protein n=1 Tax=Georgenia sp. SUBG003 TaxID=1497974 RepID=UPI0004D783A4|nr:hypothetical protein DA06_06015 [Georgenia sp. SUBG003]